MRDRERGGERVEHELNPGCVALVPAHTPVRWSWSTRINFAILRLEADFLDRVAQSVFGLGARDYRLTLAERPHDTAITNVAGVLAREVMRGAPGSRLYAQSLATILSVHLLRHYAQCADGSALESCPMPPEVAAAAPPGGRGGAHPRAVADALAFIHGHYTRELSLSDMAEAVHLSPFHLARLFKHSLGVSPHQYLIQLRVNSARWLLSAGSGERSLAKWRAPLGLPTKVI